MAYQFKIQLKGVKKPPVYRVVVVNDDITFHQFHEIIQISMGWLNYHLYQFSPTGYGSYPNIQMDTPEGNLEFAPVSTLKNGHRHMFDSFKVKLTDYFQAEQDKITYIYDFGDDWTHSITLMNITPLKVDRPYVTKGKGKCPPEDCGGIFGYEYMLEVLTNPKDPEYKELLPWLGMEKGDVYDVHEFDVDEVNEELRDMINL